MRLKIVIVFFLSIFISVNAFADSKTKILKPKNSKTTLNITVSGKNRIYYPLSFKEPTIIKLTGPGKLKAVTRVHFSPKENELLNYKVFYSIDGGARTEINFANIKRAKNALYKKGTTGTPGTDETAVIEFMEGEHIIELWRGADDPKIASRFLFTPIRNKKINWIPFTPLSPNEPVNIILKEEVTNYYRFSSDKPLKIKVNGPTSLKILTRIENHFYMKGRINYRLQIKEDNKVIKTFSLNSIKSETASYQKDGSKVPGKAKEFVISVPKGLHTYEIIPLEKGKNTVLGRILFPKKDIKLGENK